MLGRSHAAPRAALVASLGLLACHPTRPNVAAGARAGAAPHATASPWITDAREDGRMITLDLSVRPAGF